MSVPTHGPNCVTRGPFPVHCRGCGGPIHLFWCNCGSTVLFENAPPDWTKHQCGEPERQTLRGFALLEFARNLGYRVDDPRLLAAAFPRANLPSFPAIVHPPPFAKALPVGTERLEFMGVVRENEATTKLTDLLNKVGSLGLSFLGLDHATGAWQITIADTGTSPRKTFTCIVPRSIPRRDFPVGLRVFALVRGVTVGAMKAWVVESLDAVS